MRRVLLLFFLVLGLAGYWFFFVGGDTSGDGEDPTGERHVVPGFEAKQASGVEVSVGDRTVKLARKGRDWRLASPVTDRVAEPVLDELLRMVQTLAWKRRIRDAEGVPAGLDEPAARLRIERTGEGATAPLVLTLGTTDVTERFRYLRVDGKKGLFTVRANLVDDLRQSLGDLRERRILPLRRFDVTRIRVTKKAETIVLEKAGDEAWRMIEPVADFANAKRVGRLLDLDRVHIKDFDLERPAAEVGLGKEDQPLTIEFETAERKQVLRFGRPVRRGEGRYLTIEGRPGPFICDPVRLPAMDVEGWRSENLLNLGVRQVNRLEFVSGETTVRLILKEGDWVFDQPSGLAASTGAVDRLVDRLLDLEVAGVMVEDARDLANFGLDPPTARLTLGTDRGDRTVAVGRPTRRPDGRYVRRDDEGTVLDVVIPFYDVLRHPNPMLRDRTVTNRPARLARQLLIRRRIERPGAREGRRNLLLEWGEKGWQIVEGNPDGELDSDRVRRLVEALCRLRASRLLPEAPKGAKLDRPWLVAELRFAAPEEGKESPPPVRLELGTEAVEEEDYRARLSGESAVITLNPDLVDLLDGGFIRDSGDEK